jgi:hypothetical protein
MASHRLSRGPCLRPAQRELRPPGKRKAWPLRSLGRRNALALGLRGVGRCLGSVQWSNPGDSDCQALSRYLDPRRSDWHASSGVCCGPKDRRRPPMTPDALREEAMAVLTEVWSLSPDVRLGQLFAHLGFLGEAHLGRGLGDIEDDEIMAILYRHRVELTARLKATPSPTRGVATSVSGSPTLLQVAPSSEPGA